MSKLLEFDKIILLAPCEIKEWLNKCEITPQSPEWHPEAPNDKVPHNVLKHTKIVYERARQSGDVNLSISALFHDLGKADVTKLSRNGESWSAHGHEYVSAKIVEKHKKWIGGMGASWLTVHKIVSQHMRIKMIDQMRTSKQEELRRDPLFNKYLQFSEFDNMKTLTPEEFNL